MKIDIINANTDLGVHVNGAHLGPNRIVDKLHNTKINNIINIDKENIIKSLDKTDLRKNEKEINLFNKQLFEAVKNSINDNSFPIILGGDHSMAIGSALASNDINGPIGMIWIDAHGDYNTFDTTITGNIHGLPFAAISGFDNKDLTNFLTDKTIPQKNCVLVGARSVDELELDNLNKSDVTVYTHEDILNRGIDVIMEEAFSIASNNTNGIHISYDLDVIDPSLAPGVSVPEVNGIDLNTAYKISEIISNNLDKVKSLDLVEYNPLFDKDDITLNIALNILNNIIEKR